jgi:hypothetical protein
MIYYIIFLFFVSFVFLYEYKIDKNIKFVFFFISCCLLVFLSGLRGSVDGDYESYLDIYNKVTIHYKDYSNIVEPGYIFLNRIAFKTNLGFNFLVFIMAILTILPKILIFHKLSTNLPFTLIIFFSTSFFIFDFTQIRQAFAIGVFIYSLRFIIEKKIFLYFSFVSLASLFHVSALILPLGYFLFNKNFGKKTLYFIVLMCSLISFLQIKINLFDILFDKTLLIDNFNEKLNIYQQSDINSYISIKQILFGFLFIYIKNSVYANHKYLNILVNLYIFGILFATILNQISEVAFRIKWYFFWTECLLVVTLVSHFARNRLPAKFFLNSVFIIYYFIIFVILLDNLSNYGQFIYPYKFFFEN